MWHVFISRCANLSVFLYPLTMAWFCTIKNVLQDSSLQADLLPSYALRVLLKSCSHKESLVSANSLFEDLMFLKNWYPCIPCKCGYRLGEMPFLRTLKNLSADFSFFKKHACQWEMPLVPEDVCVERNRAFHSIRVENHSHQQIGRSTTQPKPFPPLSQPNWRPWKSGVEYCTHQNNGNEHSWEVSLLLTIRRCFFPLSPMASELRADHVAPTFQVNPHLNISNIRWRKERIVMILKIKTENWTRKKYNDKLKTTCFWYGFKRPIKNVLAWCK